MRSAYARFMKPGSRKIARKKHKSTNHLSVKVYSGGREYSKGKRYKLRLRKFNLNLTKSVQISRMSLLEQL